jgi:hypothetical protein
MKKYDVIIARYNEDVSWVKELDSNKFNIKLYNKGEQNIEIESISLENFGRDGHTFINYIVENYNNLPDYVIFLQGKPFDHCKNVFEMIKNHTDEPYVCLSDHVIDENINGWYEHLVEKDSSMPFPNMKRFRLKETANAILGSETPEKCTFAAGQQYIINKNYILNRSHDFYKVIIERFKIDFVLPWHVERLWFNILKF